MAAMPVLKPLHDAAGLACLIVSSYQAVSGSGVAGVSELADQAAALLATRRVDPRPDHCGTAAAGQVRQADRVPTSRWPARWSTTGLGGRRTREQKLRNESPQDPADPRPQVSSTVRSRSGVLPVTRLSINAGLKRAISATAAEKLLLRRPGSGSDRGANPLEAAGRDPSYVGRSGSWGPDERGLASFISNDNLRKGACLQRHPDRRTVVRLVNTDRVFLTGGARSGKSQAAERLIGSAAAVTLRRASGPGADAGRPEWAACPTDIEARRPAH